MYQLLYEGDEPPKLPNLPKRRTPDDIVWGSSRKDARSLHKLCRDPSRMDAKRRSVPLAVTQKMSQPKRRKPSN
jgi:hypothetical protein